MSYFFQPDGHSIRILNVEAEFILGYVDLPREPFRVRSLTVIWSRWSKKLTMLSQFSLTTTRNIRRRGSRKARPIRETYAVRPAVCRPRAARILVGVSKPAHHLASQ